MKLTMSFHAMPARAMLFHDGVELGEADHRGV
jgi:hypothetical protein